MIVSDEQFLDLSAFVWNDRPKIQRHHVNIDGSKSQVYEVTNIYKDFDRARKEMLKLPAARVLDCDNDSWFDGRSTYKSNMYRTEMPFYTNFRELCFRCNGERLDHMSTPEFLCFNVFKFDKEKFKDLTKYYYNCHTDKYGGGDTISLVIFMNDHYEFGEGMNIYSAEIKGDFDLFIDKNDIDVAHFVQGKPNTGILFNGTIPHGAAHMSDQFSKEFRYTQVMFMQNPD